MQTGAAWRLAPEQCLRWRGWDDEFVLFNDLSGDTHLLGLDAMTVLWKLAEQPADAMALCSHLHGSAGSRDAPDIDALLHSLMELALIEPC